MLKAREPLLNRRAVLGWLAALPAAFPCAAPAAAGVLLAREAPPDIDPAGYLVSEKLDGVRALWDGQRLRFRSGREVAAPAAFLQQLPPQPLDGELWLGRGRFDELSGRVRRRQPRDEDWQDLRYMVFEAPGAAGDFAQRAQFLQTLLGRGAFGPCMAVEQRRVADAAALQRWLQAVVRSGGEGLMLHRADAPVLDGRSSALLKLKPAQDAEALVLAHLAGQGRLKGRLGALRVRSAQGLEFNLGTGFSDTQRDQPPPVGSVVTYSFRGTTPGGLPRFASFLRPFENH